MAYSPQSKSPDFYSRQDSYSRNYTPSIGKRDHTYSRSPSPTRSNTNSPAYTDEFESEPEHEQHSRAAEKRYGKRHIVAGKPRGSNRLQQQQRPRLSPRQVDQATRRVMSAKNRKLMELRNELDSALKEIADLRNENRTLARSNRINEKAVAKYDSQDSQLTSIISRHSEEVRVLKDQLRKTKDKLHDCNSRRKDLDAENAKLRKHLDKLRSLAAEQDLPEREILARKLTQCEEDVEIKEKRIKELEKHVENLQKNHRHEVAIEVHRHKETSRKLQYLEAQIQEKESTLKEKEKLLDIQNIYAQRAQRPQLNNSTGSLRFHSANGKEEMTPREKMRAYEERRRIHQEEKRRRKKETAINEEKDSPVVSDRTVEVSERPTVDTEQLNGYGGLENDLQQQEEDEEKRRKQEEGERLERQREMLRNEENERRAKQAEDERKQQEAQRKQKEADELCRRQLEEANLEEARRKREAQETEERLRKEQEETLLQEKLAEERKLKEAEDRKKKDALLNQLRQLDTNLDSGDDSSNEQIPVIPSENSSKQRKQMNTKPSVENMHRGKPAYDSVPLPSYLSDKKKNSLDTDFDPKPPSGGTSKPNRKKEISMEDLFASSTESPKPASKQKERALMTDLFGEETPPPKRPSAGRRASKSKQEDLSDIFGVSDNSYEPSSGKLLPRRPSATRHQVNGSSHEADDIEEMLL